jgi:hypothetical protein
MDGAEYQATVDEVNAAARLRLVRKTKANCHRLNVARKAWRKAVARRSAMEWLAGVNRVEPLAVRVQVACDIWWDYADGRPALAAALNPYRRMRLEGWFVQPQQCDVQAGLMVAGIPEMVARGRREPRAVNPQRLRRASRGGTHMRKMKKRR